MNQGPGSSIQQSRIACRSLLKNTLRPTLVRMVWELFGAVFKRNQEKGNQDETKILGPRAAFKRNQEETRILGLPQNWGCFQEKPRGHQNTLATQNLGLCSRETKRKPKYVGYPFWLFSRETKRTPKYLGYPFWGCFQEKQKKTNTWATRFGCFQERKPKYLGYPFWGCFQEKPRGNQILWQPNTWGCVQKKHEEPTFY